MPPTPSRTFVHPFPGPARALLLLAFSSASLGAQTPARAVAFTFDDLPFAQGGVAMPLAEMETHTERLLACLKRHQVPAIGFVNEQRLFAPGEADRRIGILELWLEAGAALGNHTFAHEDAHKVRVEAYQDAIIRGDAVTRALLAPRGTKPTWFRHPVSHTGRTREYQDQVRTFLEQRGYRIAPHTIENADVTFNAAYVRTEAPRAATRLREAYVAFHRRAVDYYEAEALRVYGQPIPHVLLIHASRLNADALKDLVADFRRRGYRFISLEEALSHPAYALPDAYTGPKGLSWIQRWAVAKGLPVAGPGEPEAPPIDALLKSVPERLP